MQRPIIVPAKTPPTVPEMVFFGLISDHILAPPKKLPEIYAKESLNQVMKKSRITKFVPCCLR